MNKLDVYYRAYKDLRKMTSQNRECSRELNVIRKSDEGNDILESTKYLCTIDEEWVKAIEDGLVFVEKAVHEERQFIRTNGETVEIEKVKKISRASVEHLAKHSNMITHVPENPEDTIVPDKIYMVEKLSDYAVYENRFLYMLLIYLESFIRYRLEKIEKLRNSYTGVLTIKKEVVMEKRSYTYEVNITEKNENNPFPLPDDSSEGLLSRIHDCAQIVNALLNTDLMVQVSKAPMIKPPVTKTNVLKMNNNFKNSLALYDYIASYKGEGFTFEEKTTKYQPFDEKNGTDVAEALNFSSFIAYKIGNNLDEYLENEYQAEENRRREEEKAKLLAQIERLRKKARENSQTMEEYMALLERRNQMLEKDSQDLVLARNEIAALNKKIEDLHNDIKELNRKIEELQQVIEDKIAEIAYLNQKYIEDMAALRKQHAEEIAALKKQHEEELFETIAQAEKHLAETVTLYEEEIESLIRSHEEEVASLTKEKEEAIAALMKEKEEAVAALQKEKEEAIASLTSSYEEKITSMEQAFAAEKLEMTLAYQQKEESLMNQLQTLQEQHTALSEEYAATSSRLNEEIRQMKEERTKLINDYEKKLNEMKSLCQGKVNEITSTSNALVREIGEQNDALREDNRFVRAELDAIRMQQGKLVPSEEYAEKERFDELEREFETFKKFFKDQWKVTKKVIRKEILWKKEIKTEKKEVEVEPKK